MNIIEEPGIMAVEVPENAADFGIVQPEGKAFSTFQLTYKTPGETHAKIINANVEFSNIHVAGKCSDLNSEYLMTWCKKMGIENESYVVLKLSY